MRKPGNARMFRFALTPELVDTPSVDRAFEIGPGVGYLRIKGFEGPTGKLVKETIEKLGGANLKGLIIDLRDNPGGAVQSAVETASLFLKPDQLVFTVKGRKEQEQEVRVPKLTEPYTFPVALLMDEKSASASEILAGALQDHDRAAILGQPSYGKGLVQNVFPLSSNRACADDRVLLYAERAPSRSRCRVGPRISRRRRPGVFHTDAGREVGAGIQPDDSPTAPDCCRWCSITVRTTSRAIRSNSRHQNLRGDPKSGSSQVFCRRAISGRAWRLLHLSDPEQLQGNFPEVRRGLGDEIGDAARSGWCGGVEDRWAALAFHRRGRGRAPRPKELDHQRQNADDHDPDHYLFKVAANEGDAAQIISGQGHGKHPADAPEDVER